MNFGSLYALGVKANDVTDQALKILGLGKSKMMDMLSKTKSDSLTQQVAGAISIFPVVITNDIPVNAASVITQMLELEYANYMTIALANSPRVNISEINDAKYLQKFHTNLSRLESVLTESFNPDNMFECAMGRSIMDRTMNNDLPISPSVQKQLLRSMREGLEDEQPRIYGLDWLMEAKKTVEIDETEKKSKKEKADSVMGTIGRGGSILKDVSGEARSWVKYADDRKTKKEEQEYKRKRDEEQTVDDHVGKDFTRTFSYKTVNDMQPVPVTARIFTVDDNGTPSRAIDVVSGVKAKIHPINKGELIELVKNDNKGSILAQIIKFTTGETSFFKTLFGSDTIKKYAVNASRFHSNGSKVLSVIRRIKDINRHGGNVKPNATLIVSKAAVEELKRTVGIDLLNEDEAMELSNNLSLIKFIVCDPLAGKLHVLMPGMQNNFSVMSMDTVEKQVDATMDASLTKELRKVISKGE